MNLSVANLAVMQERQTGEAMGPEERCMMQYVQTVAVLPEFLLFQEMTDQSIAVIVTKITDNSQSIIKYTR